MWSSGIEMNLLDGGGSTWLSGVASRHPMERSRGGQVEQGADLVAEEVPVALVYNGISHAVMLATPADLEDFAVGFTHSEGIVDGTAQIVDLEIRAGELGFEAHIELVAERAFALRHRRRSLAGRTGCGLCGVESLRQLARPCPKVGDRLRVAPGALGRAHVGIDSRQELFSLTGSVHAAAWCSPQGDILLMREDVGRHNALDKLIGAAINERTKVADGFVLMTSRASYEIVQKAANVGIELVAAMSGPTGMAVRMADQSGMTLVGFLREGSHVTYTHAGRVRRAH